jgi:hypothetical protein
LHRGICLKAVNLQGFLTYQSKWKHLEETSCHKISFLELGDWICTYHGHVVLGGRMLQAAVFVTGGDWGKSAARAGWKGVTDAGADR